MFNLLNVEAESLVGFRFDESPATYIAENAESQRRIRVNSSDCPDYLIVGGAALASRFGGKAMDSMDIMASWTD
jgi:hypothetical protein